ncbi:unnamed protein product, partial [Schistosoma spindalis]
MTPSTSYSYQRPPDNNGSTDVILCSQKSLNRKDQINNVLMSLITNTSLSISDADRILNNLRDLVPDLPRSIRSILRTCTGVQPQFRLFDKVVSPIDNSTQLETPPSTVESKHVDCASAGQFDRLHKTLKNMSSAIADLSKTMQNMSSAITDLSTNVKLLLAKFSEHDHQHQFDCGVSSQQFPLSSEEELQMLDTGLQQKETRDRFMAMLTRL